MLEINKWILNTIFSIVGIIIPITIYIVSQPSHDLTYELISKSELVGDNSLHELEVKIKGELIESANIYSLVIINSGSQPIRKADFEKALAINFGKKVYSVKIINKTPENLTIQYEIVGSSVEIAPFLFNQGDEFGVEVISSSSASPTIDARIAMIKTVNNISLENKTLQRNIYIYIISFILITFYFKSAFNSVPSTGFLSLPLVRLGNIALAATCLLAAGFLLKNIVDVREYLPYILLTTLIPFIIGLKVARIERGYSHKIMYDSK
jgi:hypothetical protein